LTLRDTPDDPGFPGLLFGGGGEAFFRLASSWVPPESSYEGAKPIARAIKNVR